MTLKKRSMRQLQLVQDVVQPSLSVAGMSWIASGILLETTPSTISSIILQPLFFLVFCAFFLARAAGMSFNRLIDGWIDSKNPRTAKRAIPSGKAEPYEIALHALLFLTLFLAISFYLPYQMQALSCVIALLIVSYSFTKRITWLCHYVLGIIHFCIPLVGALCVKASFGEISPSVWFASFAAFCSVAASDILYSLQDEIFDRRLFLKSIPVRFGRALAIKIATVTWGFAVAGATIALYMAHVAMSSACIWIISLCAFMYMWHSIRQERYSLSSSLFSLLLPSLPVLFFFSVSVSWLQSNGM